MATVMNIMEYSSSVCLIIYDPSYMCFFFHFTIKEVCDCRKFEMPVYEEKNKHIRDHRYCLNKIILQPEPDMDLPNFEAHLNITFRD